MLFSCNNEQQIEKKTIQETIQSNNNDFVEYCWNKKDMEKLKTISTEGLIRNLNGIKVASNQKEMEANMNVFFAGLPDLKVTLNDTYLKNNLVFTYWTFIGTNTGVFGETPATGKKVKVSGFSIVHYNNEGRMIQEDIYYNELEFLQELGYTLNPPNLEQETPKPINTILNQTFKQIKKSIVQKMSKTKSMK